MQSTHWRPRMAIHTGETGADYRGQRVNRAARLRAIAHGEQILISGVTAGILRDALPDGASLIELGRHRLRDLSELEHRARSSIGPRNARHRTMALADRAKFVLPDHVVIEVLSLGWCGRQGLVNRQRYVEIAGDPSALKLYLKHVSDSIVSDRFQTHGDDELSSHVTKEYLGERTVASLNAAGSRYADVIRGC